MTQPLTRITDRQASPGESALRPGELLEPAQVGMITNPLSQQNKAGVEASCDLAASHGFQHHTLTDITELPSVLDSFASRGIGLIVLNGGDGTVQATLTDLIERRPYGEALPLLGLLSGGMTNMTAADVGLKGKAPKALQRLGAALATGTLDRHVRERPVLRIENIPGYDIQCGMFFGAGAIYQAIQYTRSHVHPRKVEAGAAGGVTLLRMLVSGRDGKGKAAFHGHDIAVSLDGQAADGREKLFVLATTLDRLLLGWRPFWNQDGAPIHYTAIAYPPTGVAWRAPRVLYGGNRRSLPEPDYLSRSSSKVSLGLDGAFTLDGQLFHPPFDKPIVITAENRVHFVRI